MTTRRAFQAFAGTRAKLATRFLACALLAPRIVSAQVTSADAVRFLEQSTFGPTPDLVAQVQASGFDAFLADQFSMPSTGWPSLGLMPAQVPPECDATCRRDNYSVYPLQTFFYIKALNSSDQLRQRVVFALDQILVTSNIGPLDQASWIGYYLQLLDDNAFGNFRDLLGAITLSPAMGRYLDMAGNNRNNPNENYAREILQLFSIGLYELNDDGTLITDARGIPREVLNPVSSPGLGPTYSQDTITSFARVFTGWSIPALSPGVPDYLSPMAFNQNAHDVNDKVLLGGVTLPGGRTGDADLNDALDNIFLHHNVGPFIGKQLIQKLVTSNPSPTYVARVTAAFNDNGSGVRGDMQAVIRAILLDPEARDPNPGPDFGKLKEPVLSITNLLRAFNAGDTTTDYVLGEQFLPANLRMDQDLFRSPSVFNFYPPDFPLAGGSLVGPEFAIHSTATSLARINFVYAVVYHAMPTSADRPRGTFLDLSVQQALTDTPDALVDSLGSLLLHGNLSPQMRSIVIDAVSAIPASDSLGRAQEAVYLIASSTPYQVQR